MKKLLIFFLILSVIAAGGYLAWTQLKMSPENLSHIDIVDTGDHTTNVYTLDLSSAGNLQADLNGTPVSSVPNPDCPVYQLIMHHRLRYTKKYAIYFDEKDGVFVQDLKTKRIVSVENPRFFNSHEGFDGLYPYKSPPKVEWFSVTEAFLPQKESIQWSFQKRDKQWYNIVQEPQKSISTSKASASGDSISFIAEIQPDTMHLAIQDTEGITVLEQPLEGTSVPVIQKDGTYHYLISMEWSGSSPYKGTYACEFDLAVDQPAVFEFSSNTVTQGDVITVRVHNANENEIPMLGQSLFKPFKLYKSGTDYIGYLPTGYATSPGNYEIQYGLENSILAKNTIAIKARNFRIQHLTVDTTVESSTRNDAAYAEYNKYFKPVRLTSANTLYYSDAFVLPAIGRLTTEFGETRHVNGAPTSYRHSGLDIAAPQGTPVYAVNQGKVVLARFLTLTGNTVVIDHGQGLFSIYFHMHKLLTEQSDIVEKGQQIGTVGTTGFSTGPHLHFTMSYLEQNIEPGYFLVGEPITYQNYKNYFK